MNGKPQKSWGEAQLAIAAIALAATLGFWNLFSVPHKQQDAQSGDGPVAPPQEPTQAPSPTPAFTSIKIIFNGNAPQQPQQVAAQPAAPVQTKPKPKPHGHTGSSKP